MATPQQRSRALSTTHESETRTRRRTIDRVGQAVVEAMGLSADSDASIAIGFSGDTGAITVRVMEVHNVTEW